LETKSSKLRSITLGAFALATISAGEARAQGALRFEQGEAELRALAGPEVRWSYRLAERKGQKVPAPIQVGEVVVFCHGAQLYEATAATGEIRRRMLLPGPCAALTARPDGYELRCEGGQDRQRWERSFSLAPGQGDPGTVLPGEFIALLSSRRQAEETLGKTAPERKAAAELPEQRDAALARLDQLRKQDPTNPWLDLKRAELLRAAGKAEEAGKAIEDTLAHEARYDLELLMLSAPLRTLAPEAGERAFRRGVRWLLERGYEPEMATGALVPVLLLGRPGEPPGGEQKPLDVDRDHALLEAHGERLLDVAPNAEGSTWFFAALEQAAARRGDEARAQRWRPLASRSLGTGPFAPAPPESQDAGLLVQLAAALAFALIACAVSKSLRSLSLRHEEGAPWWMRLNPFSRWDRGEQVGFLAGTAAMIGVSWKAAKGIAIVGAIASAPMALASGNPGHPEVRAYLASSPEGPAVRFFRALSAQKAGDLDEAERLYRELSTPAALANLGAIAQVRGDARKAEALWKQALQKQPSQDAALHNLGQPAPGLRAERARRYQVAAPLLAVPSEQDWGDLWRERVATTSTNPLHVTSLLDTISPSSSGEERFFPSFAAMVGDLALVALALLALLTPRKLSPASRRWSLAGAGLAVLVPGAGRLYGFFSYFVGALVVFLAMASRLLESSGGQSVTVLGSIAGADWSRFYGAAVVRPELASLHGVIRGWWVLVAVNAALVLAFDLRRALRAR
jgi:Flp pilus assembly protein TadD